MNLPPPFFAQPLIAIDDLASALINLNGHAAHGHAFVAIIIHAHVMCIGADGMFLVRVPHQNISVRANGDRAFARIHAKNLGRIGAV